MWHKVKWYEWLILMCVGLAVMGGGIIMLAIVVIAERGGLN